MGIFSYQNLKHRHKFRIIIIILYSLQDTNIVTLGGTNRNLTNTCNMAAMVIIILLGKQQTKTQVFRKRTDVSSSCNSRSGWGGGGAPINIQ